MHNILNLTLFIGNYLSEDSGLEQVTNDCFCRVVTSMEAAVPRLSNAQESLKNAIFLQQQLKHLQARKLKKDSGSIYQRFSGN